MVTVLSQSLNNMEILSRKILVNEQNPHDLQSL